MTITAFDQRPTVHCAACRVPLTVPPRYRTAHVLCPPCQARHVKLTRARTANPYPVVVSTHAAAPVQTVAYTYPHLQVPAPSSVSTDADAHRRVCMRFGCGAHLPEHVRADMCEACAGAGFVRPPPARAPNQHAAERAALPRLDLVRESLLRKAVQRATVTTQSKPVQHEPEVDLVYPDDVPPATPPSESMIEEFNAVQDEELELVYPEDVAESMPGPPPKPQIKMHPPTTLRELFTDSLQTIAILQDHPAFADNSPPRRCRMPGCDEVLPAQTCMERCVKCSIRDWERHKSAAMESPDLSQRPSTSSPTMNMSREEEQVMTIPDEMSDVKDDSDLTTSSSSSSNSRSNGRTDDRSIRPIPGWDSDLTELSSDSESESTSDSRSDLDSGLSGPPGDSTHLTIRIPVLVTRLPPDGLRRKCGNKRCNIALPKDHQWKTCDPCRRVQRMYQRMRLENKRRSVLGTELLEPPDLPYRRWRSLSPDMPDIDTTLTPETSRPCSVRHCRNRIPLSEIYRWKTCVWCRAKARREARRKRDAVLEAQRASSQPEVVPRFPLYQNQGSLLSSFKTRLKGFVESQIMYLRAKLHESEVRDQGERESRKSYFTPMIFVFVGEYSIVTGQKGDSEKDGPDRDDSGSPDSPAELKAMQQEVSRIVLELECALHTKFRSGDAFAMDKGGIIMRFTCSLELIAQLRPLPTIVGPGSRPLSAAAGKDKDEDASTPNPPPKPSAVPLVKTLSGELEAVVLPDESHRLLHGRRTVIRYSMLG